MLRQLTRGSAWSLYFLIVGLYAFSGWALFVHRDPDSYWSFSDVGQIIKYSLIQASLSATLATFCGLLTARCLFYWPFRGSHWLYQLFSFAWSLPALVVIFGLIGVWGHQGWVSQILRLFGVEQLPTLYGLHGILLAHLFLNMPLVMKYCVEGLHLIPNNQHRLAAQLGLSTWRYVQLVEWPVLKSILPYAFATVFLLCFTSFPIVLMLGGSPKYSTLEVAIFQAVTFEFDFAKAVMLIMVQLLLGIGLQLFMDRTTRRAFEQTQRQTPSQVIWRAPLRGGKAFMAAVWLGLMALLLLLPMGHVLWQGIRAMTPELLLQPDLWQAVGFSLLLGGISAITAIGIAYIIALEARQLAYHRQSWLQQWLAGVTTYPLIFPVFMLAVGLFLLLMEQTLNRWQLLLLVGLCNGLTLLPFIYRLLFTPLWQLWITQNKLAESLGLSGFRRWWIAEKSGLVRPLAQAFALAMSAGLGSFSVMAFFGSPDFATLPYLLYQQLGSYRTDEAAITALMLMLCTLLPFLWMKPSK